MSGFSAAQRAVAYSTPEAEIVAEATALRQIGIFLVIWGGGEGARGNRGARCSSAASIAISQGRVNPLPLPIVEEATMPPIKAVIKAPSKDEPWTPTMNLISDKASASGAVAAQVRRARYHARGIRRRYGGRAAAPQSQSRILVELVESEGRPLSKGSGGASRSDSFRAAGFEASNSTGDVCA